MVPDTALISGAASLLAAAALALFVAFKPRYADIQLNRRRPYSPKASSSRLSTLTGATVTAVERTMGSGQRGPFGRVALSKAGLKVAPAEFTLLVLIGSFVLGTTGLLVGNPVMAVVLAALAPMGGWMLISVKSGRRRSAFEGQLSDMLMSLSGSLRAGHGIVQSLHTASTEMPAPMSEELARIVNEQRVGRNISESMAEVAATMECEDFGWLSQAIEINREVGGDLAGVLDHVADTVRERAQIKGQVRALAAEGKFSAYILIALPFFVAAFLHLSNPTYVGVLTESLLGWVLISVGVIMMAIGSFWISRMVKINF
ncbi:type II secretion system protein F [Arthrobacter sp. UKPF54-2]|uniref:type II secretion system F family protein n=1 Tax=Arthrobacter sp. UKPF54-2 TaxID=2600159 RepID=UPI0011B15276|nr:type II secretion system F family protein [Arthrobacter sp. UKPF54-2]QDY90416.1 type II secretion system protein F [Arthrobacter sp. UKPF54-2]